MAMGYAIPPFWLDHPDRVKPFDEKTTAYDGVKVPVMVPLRIKLENETTWWQLPYEPVITINGKNIIAKRNALRQKADGTIRGTVKEYWGQDDYEITITGIFMSEMPGEIPEDEIRKLRKYCEAKSIILVESPLLTIYNINRIVIEEYSFPHTKGLENQMWALRCLSDDNIPLIVREDELQ